MHNHVVFGILILFAAIGLVIPCCWSLETYTPPEQFITDKPTDLAAIVRVDRIENCWAEIEGDMIPFIASTCTLIEQIAGDQTWPKDASQTILQSDCSSMIETALAPPPLLGHQYFVWASVIPESESIKELNANWIAHPQGILLLRGSAGNEFIYWDQRRFRLSDLRKDLSAGTALGLDRIEDPMKRIKVAGLRIARGQGLDVDSMIRGLALNIQDPEGQAKLIKRPQKSAVEEDLEFAEGGDDQPHYIWYHSLALLRDLGKIKECREKVVNALIPFLTHNRPRIPYVTALALADLGDDHGRDILRKALEEEPVVVSAEGETAMTFYGQYQYDDSSVLASAYALGKIGDRQGFDNSDLMTRIAHADGLMERGDNGVKEILQGMAANLDKEVQQLNESGILTQRRDPSDQKGRYPIAWIKVHAMLARLGGDGSLEVLVRAWMEDQKTYPEDNDLVPHGRIVAFDCHSKGWHTLGGALQASAPDPENLLLRLKGLFANDPGWNESPLAVLRAGLGDASAVVPKEKSEDISSTKARIEEGLRSNDPDKRAEALAAAGLNQMNEYFERVLNTAQNGEGIERQASIYSLSLYRRDIPEEALKRIISTGESNARLSAFELATRKNPGGFAEAGVLLLKTLVNDLVKAREQGEFLFDFEKSVTYGTQCLSRTCRSTVPDPLIHALKDPDPAVRTAIVQALGMSGNPGAVPHLVPSKDDPANEVREAAQRALQLLGPE